MEMIQETKTSLFPTYKRWEIAFEKAEGCHITAETGKVYLDFMAGIGVVNVGHGNPNVIASVEKQLSKGWHGSNLFHFEIQEKVASLLTKHSAGDLVFFCNSGAEANEAAIKLARKHTQRTKILSFKQSFHGRTYGTMAATGQDKIHEGFGPMLDGFMYLPYNDLAAVEREMDKETAAVILEIVQGEGGVVPGEDAFLHGVQKLAQEHGALLIVDEVQTGIGRTGKLFAYEHANLSPDIVTAAKGLGNGFPVGAIIGKEKLKDAFGPGSHGSTFGGNPLAMAAAEATLLEVLNDGFLQETEEKGEYLFSLLTEEVGRIPGVKAIRGRGLMAGIECEREAAPYILKLQEKGVLCIPAGTHVIRLLPPLTITKEQLLQGVEAIKNVISE